MQHIIWEAEKFVFPFINICATSNTSPTLLKYLNNVVKMLRVADIAGDLMSRYRVILTFAYSWWKDCFDLIPFEMPHHITLEEVRELYQAHALQMLSGYMLLPDVRRSAGMGSPDPLISWLSRKTNEGRVALEVMARLEGPVDNLNNAMAVSQQLLDAGWMDEDED
ncbi:hypothetical protein EDD22DRAFT_954643 [Suillus occidentalis]|nr:hypothetical protein EDD22DRAFT_954643 [Suillus occidentalis]